MFPLGLLSASSLARNVSHGLPKLLEEGKGGRDLEWMLTDFISLISETGLDASFFIFFIALSKQRDQLEYL